MQARSYKVFGATTPQVLFAFPCNLIDLDGNAAAAGYLQLHDLAVAPANAAVPLKSWTVAAAGPLPSIFETLAPVPLSKGLCLTMSSSEGTYTAVATSFDVFGEVGEYEFPVFSTTDVGDLTTGQQTQQVWAEAASDSKRLLKATFVNQSASARWAALFATDGMSLTTEKIIQLITIPASATVPVNFGTPGIQPFSLTNSDDAQHRGCSWKIIDTINPLHANAASDVAILSTYKSITTE